MRGKRRKLSVVFMTLAVSGLFVGAAPHAQACHTEEPHTPVITVNYIVRHVRACLEP